MAKRIGSQQVAFLKFEIERGEGKRKKIALQELCALYRNGSVLSAQEVDSFEHTINGIVLREGQDRKVVRWCLNALAQFGRLKSSLNYVSTVLQKYAGDPEIEAAGVAALSRMYRGNVKDIELLRSIDPIVWKLAALQNTDPAKIDLGNISIDIYKADSAVLRLALITVGLNRDIQNLFHPKHSNSEFVRHLGQHDDDVVQQYSVWSVIENKRLTFGDLGIAIDKIDDVKSNVQSKMYQLIAERDPDLRRRLDITLKGSVTATNDAREGLARGVRSNFYDGLEGVTLDWFRQEQHVPIRQSLAEHFAKFSSASPSYEEIALEIFESDLELRDRLLLGAEGTPLYSKLIGGRSPDLFAGLDAPFDLVSSIREQANKKPLRSLKVLLLTASPLDQQVVRIDAEYRDIKEALQRSKKPTVEVIVTIQTAVRSSDLLTTTLNSEVDVLHFSGHANPYGLFFEDSVGNSQVVSGAVMTEFCRSMAKMPKCVVLNACYTDALANQMITHTEVLIGCTQEIADDAAVSFSSAFYESLATGRSYEESFNLALTHLKAIGLTDEAQKYVLRRRTKN